MDDSAALGYVLGIRQLAPAVIFKGTHGACTCRLVSLGGEDASLVVSYAKDESELELKACIYLSEPPTQISL